MLQISADVMLSESEASAFSPACEQQILRLRLIYDILTQSQRGTKSET